MVDYNDIIRAVNDALKSGGKPPGVQTVSRERSAICMAADALGLHRTTVARRLIEAKDATGAEPDWSLYVDPVVVKEFDKTPEPAEPKEVVRLKDENARLRRQLTDAYRDAIGWDGIREAVLGVTAEPLDPELCVVEDEDAAGRTTVIIHLSDLHAGEVVRDDEMGGLNRFDIDVFKTRMGRVAARARSLLTDHWVGDPPERIIVILGGDLVNGDASEESAKTNDVFIAPGVRICASHIAGVVRELLHIAPVDVVSVPGNHGRHTIKIESKDFARNSFDTLVFALVEMLLQGESNVRFFAPMTGDVLLRIYHMSFAVIHGQREIGGGTGFVGPFAAILRGWQKVMAYYAAQGETVDMVISGHMHVSGHIPAFGIANGSLVGQNEYSRDLRAKPEPASQNMIVVHSQLGVIDVKQLFCGHPDEGRIYGGKQQEKEPSEKWVAA